ncbi:MAG TPA: hypothetical protein VMF66_09470 [Candidatus Acidoferrum sp.]|nr:hypothetical protein [Candidatus Acidoferrum sp.]
MTRRFRAFTGTFAGVILTALFFSLLPASFAQQFSPSLYSGLHWRMIGPFRGGRSNGVTGVPGQPDVFYFGSVGGGVWKTIDAGRTWQPIFDQEPIASIGAIGIAPSDPNLVYVGTGEADMRSQISFGDGMYKSTDAGKTWTHIGLDNTRQIGRVLVDPHDPNRVFVAALGHSYDANPDRGVYRSTDGGATWQKVLYKNENVGAIDLNFDPRDSRTIYATLWNTRRPPWSIYPPSYGPGSGIFKSTDGGDTWQQLTNGLPTQGVGRIGIAVSPSQADRVYAVVDAKDGGIYRSDDAGASWHLMSNQRRVWERGWYFGNIVVDPKNPDDVYVSDTCVYRSTDGGKTWNPFRGAPGGDDYHQLWIYPTDPNRMIVASDQGTVVSVDGGKTWSTWYNQPTAEIYHVAPDYRFPYWATGAQQDSGAVAVPSRSAHTEISMHDWTGYCVAGESGYTAPDPLHPEITFGGTVSKCNLDTQEVRDVSPELSRKGPFRKTWTLPLVFSEGDPHALYFGNQYLYRTIDGGHSWTQISADLTRVNPGVPSNLDQATAADAPPYTRRGVIYTIAPSPMKTRAGLVWIGTDDGYIQMTPDGGKTWHNVTPPQVTSWSKIVMMQASHFDPSEAYAAVDRHRLADNNPYIYRTRDSGKTWQLITSGLPAGVYMQTVKEDPQRKGLLFAGSELAVYVSFNDGDSWQSLQLNLPPCSMRDLAIHDNDLIVATHGRGFWILDDMTALRQITDQAAQSDAYLFRPETALRMNPGADYGSPMPRDEALAENPPVGAAIDYYLKSDASGPLTIDILDSKGRLVRSYSSAQHVPAINPDILEFPASWVHPPQPPSATAGMHRFVWDLRYTPVAGGSRFPGAAFFGFGGSSPAVLPGDYTVKLTVDGKSYAQPLTVKMDPRNKTPLIDLQKQFQTGMMIDRRQTEVNTAKHEVDEVRKQIAALRRRAGGHAPLESALRRLDVEAQSVGGNPPPRVEAGNVPPPPKEETSLTYLSGQFSEVARAVDTGQSAPTAEAMHALADAGATLVKTTAKWSAIKTNDVPAMNRELKQAGLPPIVIAGAAHNKAGAS